jgi:hypothetical protein
MKWNQTKQKDILRAITMNTFIEENKGLLRTCYLAAIILGWLLLVLGCLAAVGHSLALISRMDNWEMFTEYYFRSVPWDVINGIPVGLLVLGIGQFIRYVYDNNYRPSWILRNVQKLIYTYAVLFGVSIIFSTFMALPYWDHWAEITIRLLGAIIWGTGVILLLIGIALISKRIMPIIEESKTLV